MYSESEEEEYGTPHPTVCGKHLMTLICDHIKLKKEHDKVTKELNELNKENQELKQTLSTLPFAKIKTRTVLNRAILENYVPRKFRTLQYYSAIMPFVVYT